MIPYDPTRQTYTNDLSRSDVEADRSRRTERLEELGSRLEMSMLTALLREVNVLEFKRAGERVAKIRREAGREPR